MAFPTTVYTNNNTAASGLVSNAAEAGLDVSGLNPIAQLQSAVANLLISDPITTTVPAGNVTSGTFGSNDGDTGTYTFPAAVVVTGTISGITSATYSARLTSLTALATPSALIATTATTFASTVSGAVVMGFGTTNDVTIMNRAGTPVIGVVANTTGVTMAGTLGVTGVATFTTNVLVGGSVGATAAKVVALSNAATAPTTSVDLVHLYSADISAGHASLAIYSEEVVNAAVAVASTHRLPITVNGVQYALLLSTVLV